MYNNRVHFYILRYTPLNTRRKNLIFLTYKVENEITSYILHSEKYHYIFVVFLKSALKCKNDNSKYTCTNIWP